MRNLKTNKSQVVIHRIKNYLILILCIVLIISLGRNIIRIKNAGERIDRAQQRVDELEKYKLELEARLQEAQSEFHLESQLRDGLGFAREGEIVIVLPDEDILRRVAPEIKDDINLKQELPNWKKWLSLFVVLED